MLANTLEGHGIRTADCLEVLKSLPHDAVDLVFCSPPYEDARTYGIGFNKKSEEWVQWALERYVECVRVSRGLVAWVVEGKTRKFQWTATPAMLMADLHRRGVKLRKPPVFHRVGIPGSGGPDWLRNDYEFIVCASKGKLPWSDNTAMGHAPKYPPGGAPSHHSKDGRVNRPRPQREGDVRRVRTYNPPDKANPGNVVSLHGGGGHYGSELAHDNEAPFPEKLAEFFIRSFCPPGGIVLDIFGGSGTTLAAAHLADRICWSVDIRGSQAELTHRRLLEAKERKNESRSSEEASTVETDAERTQEAEVLPSDAGGDPPEVRSDPVELGRAHREDAPSAEVSSCGGDAAPNSSASDFQLI